MVELEYAFDPAALEIILLAFGFLCLVCLFAIVILTGANIRRASDAERGERITAWGAVWDPDNEHESQDPYSDETFIDSVRRHSTAWANDFQEELSCLTERLVPKRLPDDPSPLDLVAGPLRSLSGQGNGERRRSILEVNCEQGTCDIEESPVVASRRDEGEGDSRRRSMKPQVQDVEDVCDLSSKDSPA